jgi:hypothetical protein
MTQTTNPTYYVEFTIDYPANKAGMTMWNRQYSLNAYYTGKHWAQRKNDAAFWHALVAEALNKKKTCLELATTPVSLTFCFHDSLDCSNHAAMVKMIEDALKGVLIVDDSPKYVKQITTKFHDENNIRVIVKSFDDIES